MANWTTPAQTHVDEYYAWCATRPADIEALARRFVPWKLYRLKDSGHRVVISSFREAGAHSACAGHHGGDGPEPHCTTHDEAMVVVAVLGLFNAVAFERAVVTEADNLEECDLPDPMDAVGNGGLTDEELALPRVERDALLASRRDRLRPFFMAMAEYMAQQGDA